MAFGLPSKEEMRDYLISQKVPPERAEQLAADAARANAAQAARTAALSIVAGAAPARAGATAVREGITAASEAAPGFMSSVANAPRAAWEYLTVPRGVVRNPTTGVRVPTRNASTGRMERTPDYFLPGQNVAQGVTAAGALGGASLLGSSLGDGAGNRLKYNESIDRAEDPDFYRSVGANTFRGDPALDRPEDASFSPLVNNYLDRNTPSELAAYPRQVQGPLMPPPATSSKPAATATARSTAPMQTSRESQMQAHSEPPSSSFLSRLFSGPEYQSTGERVIRDEGKGVNWGSPESAADFVRADKALRAQRPEMFERQAEARGGAPKAINGGGGKDAALHKALEIIHHLLTRGR